MISVRRKLQSTESNAAPTSFRSCGGYLWHDGDRGQLRCFFLRDWFRKTLSLLLGHFVVGVQSHRSKERGNHREEEYQGDYFVDVIETHWFRTSQFATPIKATVMPYCVVLQTWSKFLNQVNYMRTSGNFARLICFCVGVALVSISLTLMLTETLLAEPARTTKSSVSGWVTPWDELASFEQVLKYKDGLSDIWFRTLAAEVKKGKPVVTFTMPMVLSELRLRLTAPIGKTGSRPRIGAFLHNATDKGFDAGLGHAMVSNAEDVVKQLRKIVRQHKLGSINIDLESLSPTDEAAFTKFVALLAERLEQQDKVRISVALHAQLPGQVADHAKFQNWTQLAKTNVDVTVMAYDYSWSTSAPGFIAPIDWVESVAKHAIATFGKDRVIMALPAYGYLWRKSKDGWIGTPEVTRVIEATDRYKAFSVTAKGSAADGRLMEKDGEHLGYETTDSMMEKLRRLSALGVERFAIWRLGGEPQDLLPRMRGLQ